MSDNLYIRSCIGDLSPPTISLLSPPELLCVRVLPLFICFSHAALHEHNFTVIFIIDV